LHPTTPKVRCAITVTSIAPEQDMSNAALSRNDPHFSWASSKNVTSVLPHPFATCRWTMLGSGSISTLSRPHDRVDAAFGFAEGALAQCSVRSPNAIKGEGYSLGGSALEGAVFPSATV